MKTIEELGEYYTSTLLSDLNDLEAHRQAFQRSLLLMGLACAAAAAGLAAWLRRQLGPEAGLYAAPPIAVLLGGAVALRLYKLIGRRYAAEFKSRLIPKLLAFIDPDLKYCAEGCVPEPIFRSSRLFGRHDFYEGRDLVAGAVGATGIQMSEVAAVAEDRAGNDVLGSIASVALISQILYLGRAVLFAAVDQKDDLDRRTIFKGVFIAANFNKNLKGATFVLPGWQRVDFGVLASAFLGGEQGQMSPVTLEDPEFNREFNVLSSDQVEARYILTPTFMQRLLKFKKMTGQTAHFSFVGGMIYAAIPKDGDPFGPSFFGPIVDFGQVVQYYSRLKIVTRLVDDLHLNTRIWTTPAGPSGG